LYRFTAPYVFNAVKKLLLCMFFCFFFILGSADVSNCIVQSKYNGTHDRGTVDRIDNELVTNSDITSLGETKDSEPDYSAFVQLTGLLFLVVLLVFVWNRKLSKLNESLNAEISQRRRMEKVHTALNRIALAVTEVEGINEFYHIVQNQVNKLMFARNFLLRHMTKKFNESVLHIFQISLKKCRRTGD